jgi:uncharacterized repeat protein (TIGR03803 family)
MDSLGNLFGTTASGGAHNCGTIYELVRIGTSFKHKVLYSFCSLGAAADGKTPLTSLIIDNAGNLYGTTLFGPGGSGVVFELTHSGTPKLKVLHKFCAETTCPNSINPVTALHYKGETAGTPYDGVSPLFGAAQDSGTSSGGIVYRIKPKGAFATLKIFCEGTGCIDGLQPIPAQEGLLVTPDGDLFGTTAAGGTNNRGMVYEISHHGDYSVLVNFCQKTFCKDGASPSGALAFDGRSIWIVTNRGGTEDLGTIFKLRGAVSGVRHNFCGTPCAGGGAPVGGIYGRCFWRAFRDNNHCWCAQRRHDLQFRRRERLSGPL